ncbi:MAG: hypothetical protein MI757_18060, partial [Pirellulales bacterium]|nr:hypothetical protein [Pirellulales bacterium]
MATKTKKSSALTLKDRLSRLTYTQACKLLGAQGKQLLQLGSQYEFEDLAEDVYLRGDLFRLRLGELSNGEPIIVTITLMASRARLPKNPIYRTNLDSNSEARP